MYWENRDIYDILRILNKEQDINLGMAIERARLKQRFYYDENRKQMIEDITNAVLSRISVDADVKDAILNIKALKKELDELKKYFEE